MVNNTRGAENDLHNKRRGELKAGSTSTLLCRHVHGSSLSASISTENGSKKWQTARSFSKSLPLSLCLWMVCLQEVTKVGECGLRVLVAQAALLSTKLVTPGWWLWAFWWAFLAVSVCCTLLAAISMRIGRIFDARNFRTNLHTAQHGGLLPGSLPYSVSSVLYSSILSLAFCKQQKRCIYSI